MAERRKIWIFAGEESGDKYGARLAQELTRQLGGEVDISGMGAKSMREAGVKILVDSTELGVVGAVEIFKHIFTFVKIFYDLVRQAEEERPDAVVLIDYPGFNLRFAKEMYKRGIPVIWYVSPQVWVWGKRRIPKLAKYCSKMLVIFPFETETYAGSGLDVEFVGHPLVDIVKERIDPSLQRDPTKFLLLPGSRSNEINHVLEPMLKAVMELHRQRPELTFHISAARPKLERRIHELVDAFRAKHGDALPPLEILHGQNSRLLRECSAGLAASGTVTVECAIAGLPLVTMYVFNLLTFIAAVVVIRKLFRNSFTMPNIIANKTIYEEFMQHQIAPKRLAAACVRILPGGERREEVLRDIQTLADTQLTCGKENASAAAAAAVIRCVDKLRQQGVVAK